MLKNILAAIGLFCIAKKGYEHYQEYSELKQRQEELEEQLMRGKASQSDNQGQQ